MTITFTKSNLMLAMRQKSHLETQNIPDEEARDNVRAGIEKSPEIERCLKHGIAQARHKCWRFLSDSQTDSVSYSDSASSSIVFDFNFSERRILDKAEPLAGALNELIVNYALAEYYVSVNHGELSKAHSLAAMAAAEDIEQLLYAKKPPRV